MRMILFLLFATLRDTFCMRAALQLELLAQRQQLVVLTRKSTPPRLRPADRLFWVLLSRLWPGWRGALVIVRPETVIAWHRKGFRVYWTWKSRRGKPGRPPASVEVRALIRQMSRENQLWGAPRIHGELLKLGFEVSEATVSKYLMRQPKPPSSGSISYWRSSCCTTNGGASCTLP
jgi:hypothetical protein